MSAPIQTLQSLLSLPSWYLLLFSLGLLSLTKLSLSLLSSFYSFLLRPAKQLRRRYGWWAVVTGPTSGIGRSLAFELARNGLHLVLVGRNPEKLEKVSLEISSLYTSTQIRTVVFDLSGDINSGIKRLREGIEGLEVGVLVNNAGVADPSALYFHEPSVETWIRMIKVNLLSLTEISRAVLPGMLERKKGAILNIGSGSAIAIPSFPLYTVYSATKAYVAQFSRSLYIEYRNKGIDVQCQAPLYVSTKMTSEVIKTKKQSPFVPNSDNYARAAVSWIGRDPICMPNLAHFLLWCVASVLPDSVNNKLRLTANLRQREIINQLREKKRNAATAVVQN